jgi:RNA polymerase sigma-B factor
VVSTQERSRELFAALQRFDEGSPAWHTTREELVVLHRPLARSIARRFVGRGEPMDDLEQVAMLGLLKAIDRYDPDRGAAFSTFATPTVLGEVRRHFRDTGWAVHVPRGLQEARASVLKAVEELTNQLGRAPRVSEIAAHLETSREQVLAGLEVAEAYAAVPLDLPRGADGRSPADSLGDLDGRLGSIDEREALRPLLAALPERERRVLYLRFFEERSQSQIASEIGVSQMHVSRILSRTLETLRDGLHRAA